VPIEKSVFRTLNQTKFEREAKMAEETKDKENGQISRREFMKDAGLCAGCAAIGSAVLLSSCAGKTVTETVTVTGPGKTATVTGAGSPVTVTGAGSTTTVTATGAATTKTVTTTSTVTALAAAISTPIFNPLGAHEIVSLYAPRLSTLAGKKIAFLACDPTKWQVHRTHPYIFSLIQKQFPTATQIPMQSFTMGTGIDADSVAQQVKASGADAVITGNAA
jgi:hypothetical protein